MARTCWLMYGRVEFNTKCADPGLLLRFYPFSLVRVFSAGFIYFFHAVIRNICPVAGRATIPSAGPPGRRDGQRAAVRARRRTAPGRGTPGDHTNTSKTARGDR